DILKLENQLCLPLYAAARLIVQAYGPSLEKLKLTYPQYLVLMFLWEKDGVSLKEIGKKLYLDSGTLTPVLQKLEASKFITRRRSEIDDRIVLTFLTKKGRELKAEAIEVSYSLFCSSGLTVGEVTELRDCVKQFLNKITVRKSIEQNA
ncbi:MAG: MarR family transcriptional regulator, partial [Bdellovibrionota bacterium]